MVHKRLFMVSLVERTIRMLHPVNWLIFMACFLLVSCTTTIAPDDNTPIEMRWEQHQAAIKAINSYVAKGSVAYLTPNKRIHMRFTWRQDNTQNYSLILTTPIGQKITDISVSPGKAQLIDNKGNHYIEPDVDQLFKRVLELSLPVAELQRLLLGEPPKEDNITLNEAGQLKSTVLTADHQDWQVQFNAYRAYHKTAKLVLPQRFEITNGDTTARFTLSDWLIP